VDDIASNVGACPITKFCDFESPDLCGFANSNLGIFDWKRTKGKFSSDLTGPSFDHVILNIKNVLNN